MAEDEPVDEFSAETPDLYDFLYKDSDRISSYYAQIFAGKLTSLEKTDTTKRGKDYAGKGNLGIGTIEGHTVNETQNALKEVRDPHDMATTDVLSYLATNDILNRDPLSAKNGEIVIASGTIFFADKSILELGITAYLSSLTKSPRDKEAIENTKLMKAFFDKTSPPSAFVLVNNEDVVISGTIHDAGMQEPIPVYYYKHGGDGLDNVHVIGIKEARSRVSEMNASFGALVQMGRPVADILREMVLPSEGVRVTPIAIFRRIGQPE